MDSYLRSIVDKRISEPRQPTRASDGNDLALRQVLRSPLVARIQQFQERHRSGEYRCYIRLQRVSPERIRSVVEIVITPFRHGRLCIRLWTCIGAAVEGRLAGVVDQQINVSGVFSDEVNRLLQIIVRGSAPLNGYDVAVFLGWC